MLNKAKPAERRNKVLFIDAAQDGYFRQEKSKNTLNPEHIAKIAAAYHDFEDIDRFAHIADAEEIEANDYNLNISRYVDTTEPVEVMSVEEALTQLEKAEQLRNEAVRQMNHLLMEVGYDR